MLQYREDGYGKRGQPSHRKRLTKIKREERRAREAVREYVRSGEHLVEAPGKIKFYLSGAFLLPVPNVKANASG